MKPDYIIFTDASMVQTKYSAGAVVILNTKTNRYASFSFYLGECSIGEAELTAVARGLKYLNTITKDMKLIKVVCISDCEPVVLNLTTNIYKWHRCSNTPWKTSAGRKVKYHKIYKAMYNSYLINNRYDVRFIHMNSHLPNNDWDIVRSKLAVDNIAINKTTAKSFIELNRLADSLAGKRVNEYAERDKWPVKLRKVIADGET